jgi:hypothetical protein
MASGFFETSPGRLVIYLLQLLSGVLLLFFLPRLRILHELNLIAQAKELIWPDIAFSALALVSLSILWPQLFRWADEMLKRNG